MARAIKSSSRKREGVIVREGVDKIEITESEQLGLKWNKPNAVMTGARKIKSASGGEEEQSAAGARRVARGRGTTVAAPAAQTVGFGRGAASGQNKSRRQPRIATGTRGPTSRAEPRVPSRGASRRSAFR